MLANFAYKIERKTLQSNPGRYESAEGGRVCLCGPLHSTEQTNNSSHLSGTNAVKTLALALASSLGALLLLTSQASAQSFSFSTNNPDGRMATASRPGPGPGSGANQETESADDFILSIQTFTTSATFTGLLPSGVSLGDVSQVRVEIYRVFPKDSDVDRTSGPPTFSTAQVPTRVNSPSDVEFFDRDSASGNLTFTTTLLAASFTAANSVDTGIHPKPNQTTLGDGPVTGEEVQFNVTFTTPFDLPADHYFFVPQVLLSDPNEHFLWLSAPRPIVAPGTPLTLDLQEWIRNADLDPDWLRVGTDIVGGTTFNATFSLSGVSIEGLVPCSGPVSGGTWKNHGQYVSTVAHVVEDFLEEGLITEEQAEAIVASAAESSCGSKK